MLQHYHPQSDSQTAERFKMFTSKTSEPWNYCYIVFSFFYPNKTSYTSSFCFLGLLFILLLFFLLSDLHPSFLSCSHRLVLPSRLWSQDFFSLNNLPSLSVAPLDFAVPLPVWPQSIYCLNTYRHSDCTVLQCWFAEGIKEEPVSVICTFGFQIIRELGALVSGQGLFLWLVISSVGYWTSRQTVLCTEAYTPVVSRQ